MRSAIVGCGNIADVHGKVIEKIEDSCLAAVADIDMERAQQMGQKYSAKAYNDLEEMLDKEQIDVLHICTPHYLHTPMAELALSRGIHVFMEKPPVISRQQWSDLKNAWENRKDGARLGFCFQNRYNLNVQKARGFVQEGTYGKLLGARGFVTWKRDVEYYTESSWRGRIDTEGGGALINQAIHTLDLIQYFVDKEPLEVRTVMDRQHLPDTIEIEDTVAAYITYPDARACLYASNGYVTDAPAIIDLDCEMARLRLEGSNLIVFEHNGTITTHDFNEQEILGKSYWGSGHMGAIADFYHCVRCGLPYPIEIKDIENTVWSLLEAYIATGSSKYKNI
jgi:predicted dehydrogenase